MKYILLLILNLTLTQICRVKSGENYPIITRCMRSEKRTAYVEIIVVCPIYNQRLNCMSDFHEIRCRILLQKPVIEA